MRIHAGLTAGVCNEQNAKHLLPRHRGRNRHLNLLIAASAVISIATAVRPAIADEDAAAHRPDAGLYTNHLPSDDFRTMPFVVCGARLTRGLLPQGATGSRP